MKNFVQRELLLRARAMLGSSIYLPLIFMDLSKRTIITDRIEHFITERGLPYSLLSHGPCRSSQESYDTRKEALGYGVVGAKALVLKCYPRSGDPYFAICVLAGFDQLDAQKLRSNIQCKKTRFATPEELADLTDGLVPGSVPPFGSVIFPKIFALYVDSDLQNESEIGFNCGSLGVSMILSAKDYFSILEQSQIFNFVQK